MTVKPLLTYSYKKANKTSAVYICFYLVPQNLQLDKISVNLFQLTPEMSLDFNDVRKIWQFEQSPVSKRDEQQWK